MRASIISRSRRAERGMRGWRSPYNPGGGVVREACAALRLPLDELTRELGMATIFVVTASVISPSGSAWTITSPLWGDESWERGILLCTERVGCLVHSCDHCATAHGESISRP